uniref:Uncharacterized protein n=1 Tax=Opuntia streptacantha TaxID=393608 RepID=A0A7C9AK84_OPUST
MGTSDLGLRPPNKVPVKVFPLHKTSVELRLKCEPGCATPSTTVFPQPNTFEAVICTTLCHVMYNLAHGFIPATLWVNKVRDSKLLSDFKFFWIYIHCNDFSGSTKSCSLCNR